MGATFNQQFENHGQWRREFALRLSGLGDWLKANDLMDASVEERLARMVHQLRSDKVTVAFVAEYSRGKSELVNAIFFAGYGQRIMPASAGRTTMCPTELGYDADTPPCLRLLPIETRLQPHSLLDLRMAPEQWTRVDLNVNDATQLAHAVETVAEVRRVSVEEARSLGLWNDETPDDNPSVGADGLVDIPRWRHAMINIAHPLLKQGLVILDTPGLNAIGSEPELTVSLIPQAHAVVFLLGADTGVTRSDLAIWREHIVGHGQSTETRLAVLNKIDGLWDELRSTDDIKAQIERQRVEVADTLGVSRDRVIAVSAHKGLVAKVTNDAALLEASQLQMLEDRLGKGLLGERQALLEANVSSGLAELGAQVVQLIHMRRRELMEQSQELASLRGKNANVVRHLHAKVTQEKAEFESSGAKVNAVRSVHLRLLSDVFEHLGSRMLKDEMADLAKTLRAPGIKLGVRKAYADTFGRLHERLAKAKTLNGEIQTMFDSTFRQLNTELGFSLNPPRVPDLDKYVAELAQVENNHLQYLGVSNILRLAQPEFTSRLIRALVTRLRVVFEGALAEVEFWSKSAAAQLDVQLRERHRNFNKRLDALERIESATSGLNTRVAELQAQLSNLDALERGVSERTVEMFASAQAEPAGDAVSA